MAYHPHLAELAPNGQPKGDFLRWFNGDVYVTDAHLLAGGPPGHITYRPLPEAFTQSHITPRMVIFHTQASGGKASNASSWSYAARSDVYLEPHLFGPQMDDGAILQCLPFNVRADVNSLANSFVLNGVTYGALSVETQDLGGATVNDTPWTFAQVGGLVEFATAVCFTYGIACTDTAFDRGSGISPHNRWPSWSSAAHSCPGNARTRQMDAIRQEVANRLGQIHQYCGTSCP